MSTIITSQNIPATVHWLSRFISPGENLPEFIYGTPSEKPEIEICCPDRGAYDHIIASVSHELNPVCDETSDVLGTTTQVLIPGLVKIRLFLPWL